MTDSLASDSFPYFGEEHAMLRNTLRRFIADRVLPYGDAWEEQGFVPREVLREMGSLGLLGMRFAPEHGGAGLDTLANVVLAEELGRCTYGGFAVTVLVHTDMASPHLYHAGTAEQLDRWMPDITAGRKITAVAMTEADAGSDLASMRTNARKVDGGYRAERRQDVHHQRRARRPLFRRRQDRRRRPQPSHHDVRASRRARRASASRARSRKPAGCRSDTAELVFEDCFVPDENVIGEDGRGFYALVKNLQNERIVIGAHGAGRSHEGHRDHARLGQAAPGLRRGAVGEAGHPPAPVDARWPRSRRPARSSSTRPGATARARTSSRKCR